VFIDLIKGSSVASIIGFIELMQTAINARNSIFDLSPIVVGAVSPRRRLPSYADDRRRSVSTRRRPRSGRRLPSPPERRGHLQSHASQPSAEPLALLKVKHTIAYENLARLVAETRRAMPAALACPSIMHGIVTQEIRLPGDSIVAECRLFGYLAVAAADLAAYPGTPGSPGLRGQRCRQMHQPWRQN
jgi:hypothetical protein